MKKIHFNHNLIKKKSQKNLRKSFNLIVYKS